MERRVRGALPDLAVTAGLIADAFSVEAAIRAVAALTAASGLVVVVRMYETHPQGRDAHETAARQG